MTYARCLACHQPLVTGMRDYHPACSRSFYGTPDAPELPYDDRDIAALAVKLVQRGATVPGVQRKLSVDIEMVRTAMRRTRRLTIVGLWGRYILKPPSPEYPSLPEVEDITMHLARLSGIATVPHALIRMKRGRLAYITRRIDRTRQGAAIHMEDMCQLTERLTEHKYRGSHEQIAQVIVRACANPGLDLLRYHAVVLFSFLVGNADMHLKNFSLIDAPKIGWSLSPAYDLLATVLVNVTDTEELALTLNGRKRRLTRRDFETAFARHAASPAAFDTLLRRFARALPDWPLAIEDSFLPAAMKTRLLEVVRARANRLDLSF